MAYGMDEMTERRAGINKAFGRIYFAIYSVDLECDRYLEISTLDIFKEYIPPQERTQLLFDMVVLHYVSEGYKDAMRAFLNMDTLQERLSKQNAVSNEFFGTTQGWCRASLVVEERDENGRVLRFAYVTQEINEEVKTEQQRIAELKQAYKEAEKANRIKSDFLFQMSHDIRTPLNAIMGFETLLEKRASDPAKVKEYAAKIRMSGDLLLSFLNEILDMADAESGRKVLNTESFSMRELIGELSEVIRSQAEQKSQSFTVDISAVEHDRFIGDRGRISRVLFNILGNAIRYTREGGAILFRIREKETEQSGQALLVFQIRDNGIGITPELRSQIFEKFVRGNENEWNRVPGVGLGLPIAKSFTEMMGGVITVESEPGRGSEFTVRLPLAPDDDFAEDKDGGETEISEPDVLSGLNILIVEDNELNMEIITEILQMAGAVCDAAYSGEEAIQKIAHSEADAYDLIVMDVCMPQMDGYETTRRIRGMDRPDVKTVPIVAVTANAFEEDIRNSKEAGMDAHLPKPLDMALFKRTVKSLLQGR